MGLFYVGAKVVTRKGKYGTVAAVTDSSLAVRFGSHEFAMKPGQVILATEYERMNRRGSIPYNQR